jgi:hypothetical protein
MKEHFVTYEQALALKELGFEEPCIGWMADWNKGIHLGEHEPSHHHKSSCNAILKSQVFKWFREVHKIHGSYGTTSDSREEINGYCISNFIDGNRNYLHINWEVGTYEEAESECIDKLISIIKEKKS